MSLSNLSLDALEVIAESGTIVQAALKLGVTQTALTQRIKLLERELETPLFLRSRKGMTLTEEGKILYKYCQDRRLREASAIQKIKGSSIDEPRRLRISGPTMQTQTRILNAIPALREKYPYLYFSFDIDDSSDLYTKLKENKADIILSSSPPSASFKSKKLERGEFILVGPYAWRTRSIKEIIKSESIIDFNPQDAFTLNFLNKFKLLPKSLPEKHFINNTHQMIDMIEMGLGYAVFDIKHVEEKIRSKKLVNLAPELKMKIDWYLSWNDHGEAVSELMDGVVSVIE